MLIQLNAEVWMGILNWLLKYRREMAEKFCQFGDVEFSHITQTWLHEWTRNVALGDLRIDQVPQNQLAILNRHEIPANITHFSSITIRSLDAEVLQFFLQVQQLFSKVNLVVDGKFPQRSKTALRQMLPLLHGIESLVLYAPNFELFAFFWAEFSTKLYGASILGIAWPNHEEHQDSVLRWLFTPREDRRPRTLMLGTWQQNALEIVAKFREDFLDPLIGSMSYFVRIETTPWWATFEASTIQNTKGEQLIVQTDEKKENVLLIARCPLDVGKEWLAQKFKELADYDFFQQKRRICFCRHWSN